MQNEMAKARRKAEETRASVEAKRDIQTAKVLETNLMRVVGRPPIKRSFFLERKKKHLVYIQLYMYPLKRLYVYVYIVYVCVS